MKSNTDILIEELSIRKEGTIQKTTSEIATKYGRNRRHILGGMKQLEEVGIITITGLQDWKYVKKSV